jgi:hypothetical protein
MFNLRTGGASLQQTFQLGNGFLGSVYHHFYAPVGKIPGVAPEAQ